MVSSQIPLKVIKLLLKMFSRIFYLKKKVKNATSFLEEIALVGGNTAVLIQMVVALIIITQLKNKIKCTFLLFQPKCHHNIALLY